MIWLQIDLICIMYNRFNNQMINYDDIYINMLLASFVNALGRPFARSLACKIVVRKSNQKIEQIRKRIPIQTIRQLVQERTSQQVLSLDRQHYEPSQLFLTILRSFKKNLHLQKVQSDKMTSLMKKYIDNIDYVKKFIYILLPADQLFPEFNQIYLEVAFKYLKADLPLHKEDLFYILENMERMVVDMKSGWTDEYWIVRDYYKQQQIINLLVPKLIAIKEQQDISDYVKLAKICSTLSAINYELAAYLLDNIDHQNCRVKLLDFINVLYYLSLADVYPYQFFYKNKQKWIKTIQSYNKYSAKKSFQSIKMLQLLAKVNPMFCQVLIRRVQQTLIEAIPSIDPEEQANLWFLICKCNFGIFPQLTSKVLEKLLYNFKSMSLKELCLIVRGFERFREIQQYVQISKTILSGIAKILDQSRAYEHEIIKYLLTHTLGKQQSQAQSTVTSLIIQKNTNI